MSPSTDWNEDNVGGLVSIGTHSLYFRAAGPARSPGATAVVCIAGLGDSSRTWTAVLRHISAFARVYVYDRTGLGDSEIPPSFISESKTYIKMAKELKLLLDTAGIKPPYILVMHSMAGIPGREFFNLYPEDVVGMVFLDTVTEETHEIRPVELEDAMTAVYENLDTSFMWDERKPAMTEEEWKEFNGEGLGNKALSEHRKDQQIKATQFEVDNFIPSSRILAEKKQFDATVLGDRPVSVIKGDTPGEIRACLEKAIAAGTGTAEQRQLVINYWGTADEKELMLQFKQLRLSRNSRLVEARESWHNIQLHQPDLVAREVKWCLEEFEKSRGDCGIK